MYVDGFRFVFLSLESYIFKSQGIVCAHRMRLLRERDDNEKPEWINKLPMIAKQLQVSLYRWVPRQLHPLKLVQKMKNVGKATSRFVP